MNYNYIEKKTLDNYKKTDINSWEDVKKHIKLRNINTKYLSGYSKDVISKPFLDLSLVISLEEKQEDYILSHLLTKKDIKKYNISVDDIFEVAIHNSLFDRKRRILPLKEFMTINDILYPLSNPSPNMKIGYSEGSFINDIDTEEEKENILVICNKNNVFGASYMCIPEVLKEVYERFDYENFYILPMTIHSVWCVRKKFVTKNGSKSVNDVEDDLLDSVEKFNDTKIEDYKDILSYKIYYYSGDDGEKLIKISS